MTTGYGISGIGYSPLGNLGLGSTGSYTSYDMYMPSMMGMNYGMGPHIVHADVAQPRHVRYLARDAPPRTLEEKTEIHVRGMTLPLMRQCWAPRKHTLTADNRAKINLKIKSTCKKIRRKSVERNHGAVFYARDIRLRHAQSFSNFKLI